MTGLLTSGAIVRLLFVEFRKKAARLDGPPAGGPSAKQGHRCIVQRAMALIALMSLRPRARKSTIRNRTARPRTWGLSLIGKRSRFLGFVEATDQEAAESAVVDGLGLSHKQRKRLVVQELPGKVRAAAVSALNLNDEQRKRLVVQERGY